LFKGRLGSFSCFDLLAGVAEPPTAQASKANGCHCCNGFIKQGMRLILI
jgi:hypothetical protein